MFVGGGLRHRPRSVGGIDRHQPCGPSRRCGATVRGVQFLSPEWRRALREAAATNGLTRDQTCSIGIEVHDGVDRIAWRMHLGPDGVMIDEGSPDVTLVVDRVTAAALAQGTLNAQRALTDGRLSIRGDARTLAAADATLAALGDVFAAVRAATDFS